MSDAHPAVNLKGFLEGRIKFRFLAVYCYCHFVYKPFSCVCLVGICCVLFMHIKFYSLFIYIKFSSPSILYSLRLHVYQFNTDYLSFYSIFITISFVCSNFFLFLFLLALKFLSLYKSFSYFFFYL